MLGKSARSMLLTAFKSKIKDSVLAAQGNLQVARFSDVVNFAFIESKSGNKILVEGTVGKTVLDTALQYDVDIEGACGGELACSTCHVIVPKDLYDRLPEKKLEEDDMLDLAWGLTPT
jgi:ferredoxin